MNVDKRSLGLNTQIIDGVLSISIGVDALINAVKANPNSNFFGLVETMNVTDNDTFAEAILGELTREEEDGSTPVHRMLDAAADEAIEQGCEGVESIEGDDE